MAEVFLVESPGLGGTFRRRMALKRILPGLAGDVDYTRQFLDEARLLGRMHHPNIVTAADAGTHEGSYFLVMELVEGSDLGTLLRSLHQAGERLPQSVAVHVAAGVAAALAYAHGPPFEVVHRDVSPQNVLLGHNGEVVLADFGIARYAERDHRTATTWQVKGKVEYMSPEQIDTPRLVDGRSDLFSLGVVLYQMLTGSHPFLDLLKRQEQQQVLSTMLRARVPPPIPGIEPELAQLVRNLLARDRAERPAAAGDVLDVLHALPQRAAPARLLATYVRRVMSAAGPNGRTRDLVSVDGLPEDLSRELELADEPGRDPLGIVVVGDDEAIAVEPMAPAEAAQPRQRAPKRNGRGLASPAAPHTSASPRRSAAVLSAIVLSIGLLLIAYTTTSSFPPRPISTNVSPPRSDPVLPPAGPSPAPSTSAADLTASIGSPDSGIPPPPSPLPPRRDVVPPAVETAVQASQLFVAVIPWGRVWLNGEFAGEAPHTWDNLKPGRYLIEVGQEKPVQRRRVRLKPGANRFEFELP